METFQTMPIYIQGFAVIGVLAAIFFAASVVYLGFKSIKNVQKRPKISQINADNVDLIELSKSPKCIKELV